MGKSSKHKKVSHSKHFIFYLFIRLRTFNARCLESLFWMNKKLCTSSLNKMQNVLSDVLSYDPEVLYIYILLKTYFCQIFLDYHDIQQFGLQKSSASKPIYHQ